MSLRWRVALLLGGIAFIAMAGISTASYVSTARELDQSAARLLDERVKLLRGQIATIENTGRRQSQGALRDLQRLEVEVQVVLRNGRIVQFGDVRFPITDRVAEVVERGEGRQSYETVIDGDTYLVRIEGSPAGAALVGIDRTSDIAVLAGLRNRMIVIGLLATAMAATVGWLVAMRITRPIERLTAATGRVARTHDLTPVPVEGDAEVGALAASFNAMLAALRASKDQQRRLVEDASHELRTPLTSVRTNVELLQSAQPISDADRAAILDDLNSELAELTVLVGELVDLARDAQSDEPVEPVAIDEVLSELVDRVARRSGREITALVEPVTVDLRRSGFERAVTNLLNNAVKFSPDGTAIEVRQEGRRVLVRDHGPGIADHDKPKVFDRFYRADATRSAPGSGLGLSIVAQVVADAGGTTIVEDAPGGGAVVGFELPPEGSTGLRG